MPVTLSFEPSESIYELVADLLTQYEDRRAQAFLERSKNHTIRPGPIIREAAGDSSEVNELLKMHPELDQDVPALIMLYISDQIADQALSRAIGMHEDNDNLLGAGITGIRSEELVRQFLDLRLAWMLLPDIEVSRERCIGLSELILRTKPSDKVIRYLVHLSRCYLAQLDASVVILCRAVLENVVQDCFEAGNIEAPSRMKERLQVAVKLGWISENVRNDAMVIWTRGNKAVHDDPDLVQDAEGTIALTLQVCSALYNGMTRPPSET